MTMHVPHRLQLHSFYPTYMGLITPEQGNARKEFGKKEALYLTEKDDSLPNLLNLLGEIWGVIFKYGNFTDFFQFRKVSKAAHSIFWNNVTSLSLKGNEESVSKLILTNKPSSVTKVKLNKQNLLSLVTAITQTPLRNINALWLNECSLQNSSDIEFLASLHNLNTVIISGCSNFNDYSLEFLSKATNLITLSLTNCDNITDNGINTLALRLHKIKTLQFNNCPRITDKTIEYFTHLPLSNLDLKHCSGITDHSLQLICKYFPQLLRLYLSCCSITDNGIRNIPKLHNLEILDLSGCSQISDNGVNDIAKLSNLKQLSLSFSSVSDTGLSRLKSIPSLVTVDVRSCPKISGVGVINLQLALRNASIILGK